MTPRTCLNPTPATFEQAVINAHVRSAVFHGSEPGVLYWKNSPIPMRDRVPYEKRMSAYWFEHDPREGSEKAWIEFQRKEAADAYDGAARLLGVASVGLLLIAMDTLSKQLTPRQKDFICGAIRIEGGRWRTNHGNIRTAHRLQDLNLGGDIWAGTVMLNDLGMAIRQYLINSRRIDRSMKARKEIEA